MNFDFVPTRFDIKVGDRVGGYLVEEEYRNWDGGGWTKVWKLYTNDWDELAKFDTLGKATKNLHILEEYLSTDECWLER